MKFRSKNGSIHKTLLGAKTDGFRTKVRETLFSKLPGYKEVVEDDNFDIDDDYTGYDEQYEDEDDFDSDTLEEYEESTDRVVEDNDLSINNPHNITKLTVGLGNIGDTDENNNCSELIEEIPKHIEIDYGNKKLLLKRDDNNEIIAESEIDPILIKGMEDSSVFKILYPNGIPADIYDESITLSKKEKDMQDKAW